MKSRKKLWWLALPIGIAALWFGFVTYLDYIDSPLVDEYPKKSIKNEFMLYNDGCCFSLTDFSIWLSDDSGEEYPLFSHTLPPYGKRFIADFPRDISGGVHAVVSFNYEYETAGFVSFPIMGFESLTTLKKDGLLLLFGDGTLKVMSGRQEVLFSYDKESWADSHIDYSIKTTSIEIENTLFDIKYMTSKETEYRPYYGSPNLYSCSEKDLRKESLVDYDATLFNVNDEESAIKAAAFYIAYVYEHCIMDEQPFVVYYNENAKAWIVHGALPEMTRGGVASIAIKETTGDVLMLLHTK